MTELVEKAFAGRSFRVVDPSTYYCGSYEFEDELDVKAAHWSDIQPEEVVFDIGAAWGGYTLPALALGATVIAVEPGEISYPVLCASVAANPAFASRFRGVNAVIASQQEPIDPVFERDILGRNFPTLLTTPRMTLDALAKAHAPDRLDRIKMDVEGAELDILESGPETLARFRPRLVIEDHTAERPEHAAWMPMLVGMRDRVIELLRPLGYVVTPERPAKGNPFLIAKAS